MGDRNELHRILSDVPSLQVTGTSDEVVADPLPTKKKLSDTKVAGSCLADEPTMHPLPGC